MRSTRFWALALGAAALCCAAAILVLRLTAPPAAWAVVYQDGEVVERRALAHDGSTIQLGGLVFRLRLEEENAL